MTTLKMVAQKVREGKMANNTVKLDIMRKFTKPGTKAYDQINWVSRDSVLTNPMTKETVFEQLGVEFPDNWSLNAINIVSQKYFSGTPGSPDREASLKTLINRVADTITRQGASEGYFESEIASESFREELKYILATQRAAFNSPVWFNIGASGRSQQASACFILGIEDTMGSILNWYKEEGMIFKGGSGSGVNLSPIRSSVEKLGKSAGTASGPLSFMRGADSSAGAIKSGGKTRRAAKMVILNVDHPDVEEFIWCKAIEERKARVLREAGFDMSLDGKDIFSVQYQNANNSVRVSDDFMQAVKDDQMWDLRAVTSGDSIRQVRARDIWRQIAEAAWECADPGLQFDTTINDWHTTPKQGRINGSNPCSEYMHLDNSACNLASINLLKFLRDDGTFDVDAFKHTVEVIFTGQEILVGYSDYPTDGIGKTARAYRELGIGYANLGALLMAQGLPYDSAEGRAQAAAITALMTGHSYATSAKIANKVGTFAGFSKDKDGMLRVIRKHRDAVSGIDATLVSEELLSAASASWDEAVELGTRYGVRNSQASVLAPTGTIGLMMDCDTTGIEPDLGLVKVKKLVGGGTMHIVNQTVPRALKTLGYTKSQIQDIITYIDVEKSILGAPHLKQEHINVFACSMGDNSIHYEGHVRMMGAVQPFLSGAISKTVNMPEEATVEEIEQLHMLSWELGLKAVAIYRDNCKVAQPLSMAKKAGESEDKKESLDQKIEQVIQTPVSSLAVRRELPKVRNSKTFSFTVADCHGYFIVGEYEDGKPGELFISVAKMGSTLAGLMDSFARSISYGLQHGIPLKVYVKGMTSISFAPSGITDDPEVRTASSLIDYIFRRLAISYMSFDDRLELGLANYEDMPAEQTSLADVIETTGVVSQSIVEPILDNIAPVVVDPSAVPKDYSLKPNDSSAAKVQLSTFDVQPSVSSKQNDAPMCYNCGNQTQKAGSCYVCTSCGSTTGCS
jgi:ribonucleoside-diphosphate reductase alpha chain